MAHSKVEIYVHVVWGTWKREEMVTEVWENRVYSCLRKELARRNSEVIAIGGVTDHVHALLRLSPTEALADLIRRAKGVSSHMVNENNTGISAFKWQPGYGAFSLSRTHLDQAEYYVRNQKRHHERGDVWPVWEETSEEDA